MAAFQTSAPPAHWNNTVEVHRESLMQKHDHHHTIGLTRHVISAGIIESNVQLTII
jgi:hypothetical protein